MHTGKKDNTWLFCHRSRGACVRHFCSLVSRAHPGPSRDPVSLSSDAIAKTLTSLSIHKTHTYVLLLINQRRTSWMWDFFRLMASEWHSDAEPASAARLRRHDDAAISATYQSRVHEKTLCISLWPAAAAPVWLSRRRNVRLAYTLLSERDNRPEVCQTSGLD